MIYSYGNISIISKDRLLIKIILQELNSIQLRDSTSCPIIFIDQRLNLLTHKIIEDRKYQYFNKIFIIEKTEYRNISEILNTENSYILEHPINLTILRCILEKLFKSEYSKTYHGLELNIKQSYILFNNYRINLTQKEMLLLTIIIKQNGFATNEEIMLYIPNLSHRYMQVLVTRINQKSFKSLGLRIIKNRYAKGYYISI